MKYFHQSGINLGVKKRFYFSQLWPTSFYGVLCQSFALAMFNKNFAYFQHCIYGIQRDKERCYCIGVINDINEGIAMFEDYSIEDLY